MNRNDYIRQYAVDARWFLELKRIKQPLLLGALNKSIQKSSNQFRNFTENPKQNPESQKIDIDRKAVDASLGELIRLREQVLQFEAEKSICEAYEGVLSEKITEMELLLASITGDWVRFEKHNKSLYGDVDGGVVRNIRSRLAARYSNYYPDNSADNLKQHLSISKQTFDDVGQRLALPKLAVKPVGVLTAEQVVDLWNGYLEQTYPGWRCEQSREVLLITVVNRKRRIYIPQTISMLPHRMLRMFAHEVGIHLRRREAGKQSKMQLLSIGLANSQSIEEGLGLMAEQVTAGTMNDFGGFDKYLTLAVAIGEFDGVKRDFKDTYGFMLEYYLRRKLRKHSTEKANKLAAERAWRSAWRVFRGGNPVIPGCCFYKDKIYREGNIKVWEDFLANPDHLNLAMLGKFNHTEQSQRALAKLFSVYNT